MKYRVLAWDRRRHRAVVLQEFPFSDEGRRRAFDLARRYNQVHRHGLCAKVIRHKGGGECSSAS